MAALRLPLGPARLLTFPVCCFTDSRLLWGHSCLVCCDCPSITAVRQDSSHHTQCVSPDPGGIRQHLRIVGLNEVSGPHRPHCPQEPQQVCLSWLPPSTLPSRTARRKRVSTPHSRGLAPALCQCPGWVAQIRAQPPLPSAHAPSSPAPLCCRGGQGQAGHRPLVAPSSAIARSTRAPARDSWGH